MIPDLGHGEAFAHTRRAETFPSFLDGKSTAKAY
jgi:hypothetical protein